MKLKLFVFILIPLTLTTSFANELTPAEIFKDCAKCHGKDGKNPAYGRSAPIAGQKVEDLIQTINVYRNNEFRAKGVTTVMAKRVRILTDKQVKELAIFISKMGKN
ncbi:c-type cytochrome [Sulfurospirillum arcachonense]|uniref:c-type cytochrome n=1 Tax=Sulfurospirillum arcachonense TaxID=57666 RepID=UPI0004693169|nr:c-type cytochrome [Sulfurospirillum arcachonense]